MHNYYQITKEFEIETETAWFLDGTCSNTRGLMIE